MDINKSKNAKSIGIKWKRGSSGKIKIFSIPLSKIVNNSYMTKYKCNCRNIRDEHVNSLISSIKSSDDMIDVIFTMKNKETGMYHVADGNHLQCAAKRLGYKSIRAYVMEGDASDSKQAWNMYCISFRYNKESLLPIEKMECIFYGSKVIGKVYVSEIKDAFGLADVDGSIKNDKKIFNKITKLPAVERDNIIKEAKLLKLSQGQIIERMVEAGNKKPSRPFKDDENEIFKRTVHKLCYQVERSCKTIHTSTIKDVCERNVLELTSLLTEHGDTDKETLKSFMKHTRILNDEIKILKNHKNNINEIINNMNGIAELLKKLKNSI